MGKKLKRRSVLEQVSTKPNPESIRWAGTQFSILSAVMLWGMWLCRIFSPLQWIKLLYRASVTAVLRFTRRKDRSGEANGSGRVNVPPLLCEIYFLLWLAFFALVYWKILTVSAFVMKLITAVYLFESVVWVLYYTIFRRFFEARYTIYHELEYLSALFLVIPTQGLCFALRYSMPFQTVLAGLLGANPDGTPFPVLLLGILFMAIVVSMIISAFPTEKVKKYIPRSKMLILGNGYVVKQRLIPALSRFKDEISGVYTLPADGDPEPGEAPQEEYCRLIRDNLDHNSIVWIETPTYTHVGYLKRLLDTSAELIVLEKPITADPDELTEVEKLLNSGKTRSRIFFLSYYLLEKALPLHWLLRPNTAYLEYLDTPVDRIPEDWRERLGKLKRLDIQILEGEDDRSWAKDPRYGGQWLETFFHNVLLASQLAGLPQFWQGLRCTGGAQANELHACSNGALIHLLQKKGVPENGQKRFLEAEYAGGRLYVDLQAQSLRLTLTDQNETYHIRVGEAWKTPKYGIMADLVLGVKQGRYSAQEVDGLQDQLAVNRWLLEQRKQAVWETAQR